MNKNQLDEMQEQKLLKIERTAAWFAFWGLFLAILIQLVIDGENVLRNIIGEGIVFLFLCIYMIAGCIKNGIWDRRLKPNATTNSIISAIFSFMSGVVFFLTSYNRYHKLLGSIATGLFIFISMFFLIFATLSIFSSIYKKRLKQLEEKSESD